MRRSVMPFGNGMSFEITQSCPVDGVTRPSPIPIQPMPPGAQALRDKQNQ